jgi:hypothetical protein
MGLIALALCGASANVQETFVNSPHYAIWCVGNCDTDVKTQTTPGAVLMGGSVCPGSRKYLFRM